MLQFAELIPARDVQWPRVVALTDAVRRFDQGRDRPRQLTRDEPGADQSQREQRQGEAGEHAAHALDLVYLLMLELRADAGERFLHPCPADPDREIPAALRQYPGARGNAALDRKRADRGLLRLRIAAGKQDAAVRIRDLDPLDVPLLEQPRRKD